MQKKKNENKMEKRIKEKRGKRNIDVNGNA